MRTLKNDWLIQCYMDAVRLQLDPEFIDLLLEEIHRRSTDPAFRRMWMAVSHSPWGLEQEAAVGAAFHAN
ncbi:sporulation histidine kinase inhibitor Sda [Paenibacillus elgii]|uniref:Sporulation histidine kinase inhibitor Sda n=1 Tax=Paenibacillus elgii TaxID=189691 RepID=A0A2T6FSK7_9BACL|nr:sporulation histidine kinase inhibitor Sda [Paenibacillus elgii]PUA34867.1 sporulation histidine kinase inhibitor Sda [Paenibacillus elgii]